MMSETSPRTVAIAMDGSEFSNKAFEWYLQHVRSPEDKVVLIHCPEYLAIQHSPLLMAGDAVVETDMRSVLNKDRARIHELVHHLEEKLKDAKVAGKVVCVGGSAGEVVVRTADEENASIIITGTRGMGVIRRTFLGSVSDYILHHSHVPVVVCRHKDK